MDVVVSTPSATVVAPASYKVIYAFSDDTEVHKGRLKVGDATLHTTKALQDITQQDLEKAARARIDAYTKTADLSYTLHHVELALKPVMQQDTNGAWTKTTLQETFRDYKVHEVLMRSGFKKTFARSDKTNGEWFEVTVEEVKAAIRAVKEGTFYLSQEAVSIKLRPEQEAAAKQTLKCFHNASFETPKRMLWNAKMRFGKTLTAYEVVKKLSESDETFKRVLIITHRPDVNDGWSEDFQKMGLDKLGWTYGSKKNLMTWDEVKQADKFIWFASIQDLRGTDRDAIDEASFKKANEELFATEWSCIVNDEVHEGTLTELAKRMFAALKSKTYLDLSGTPFNVIAAEDWEDEQIAERFSYDDRYNWSYPDERRAKKEWDELYSDKGPNPYADLPELRFVTYDISEGLSSLSEEEVTDGYGGVSFTELFKTSVGALGRKNFVHEEQVLDLLHKMRGLKKYSSDPALFPYHRNFKNYFNHTLWMLPNVAACEAMEGLLKLHESGFAGYRVVNATGVGSESWESDKSALEAVRRTIASSENTITLSQQMLTTGVTVTPWTGVFMFNNTNSPMLYMQTAFRAASPGCLPDGRLKEYAYVFDFNPDRYLRQIVEVAKANAAQAEKDDPVQQASNDEASVREYLEYMSLLSVEGAKFVEPDSNKIMEQLNEAYINEVVEKGFDSPRLWNSKQLQSFDIEKVKILEALRKLQGGREHDSRNGLVAVSSLSDKERARLKEFSDRAAADPAEPLSGEGVVEKKELEVKEAVAVKQERKNRQNAVSILAGVAARLPMLVYASPAEERITPENFASLVDEESWKEFMPKNLLRVMPEGTPPFEERQEEALGSEGNLLYWDDVRRFFDPVIFSLSCERIRRIAREIGEKPSLERAFRTACLFATFRNPDKETVLTPARVVELQYTSTLGGLSFLDLEASTASHVVARLRNVESGELETHGLKLALTLLDAGTHVVSPVWVEPEGDELRKFWESSETTVLDINSKTALYPLFAAVSLFYRRCGASLDMVERLPAVTQEFLWKSVVEEQVFANCRVPYSARIARRVLAGYNDSIRVNTSVVDVIGVRKKLKEVRVPKGEGKKDTRPLTSEEEELVWRSIFNPEAMRSKMTEDLVKELLMADNEKVGALLKKFESENLETFSCVVGNPPYQDGHKDPIYQGFGEISLAIARYQSLIHPATFLTGDRGIFTSLKNALLTKGTLTMEIFDDSSFIFPGIDLPARIAFYLHDNEMESKDSHLVVTDFAGDRKARYGPLTVSGFGSIIEHEETLSIVNKVNRVLADSMASLFEVGGSFGLDKNAREHPSRFGLPNLYLSKEAALKEGIEPLMGLHDTDGKGVFTKKHQIFWGSMFSTPNNPEAISGWKVLTPRAYGRFETSSSSQVIGDVFLAAPGEVCTGSYAFLGPMTESEAIALAKYLKTRFARFLIRLKKPGVDITKNVFSSLPLQDFSSYSDLPWEESISEIESSLYRKYGFTDQEISVIESTITEF